MLTIKRTAMHTASTSSSDCSFLVRSVDRYRLLASLTDAFAVMSAYSLLNMAWDTYPYCVVPLGIISETHGLLEVVASTSIPSRFTRRLWYRFAGFDLLGLRFGFPVREVFLLLLLLPGEGNCSGFDT